jgi:hypothetical protein
MTPIKTDLSHPRAQEPLRELRRLSYWIGVGTIACGAFFVLAEPGTLIAGGVFLMLGAWMIIQTWLRQRAGARTPPGPAA